MKKIFGETFEYLWKYKAILLLCVFIYVVTLFRILPDGGFGCSNGSCGFILGENNRDGIWFMAVAATAFKTFPFQLPVFSGAPLLGYYYFPALIVYLISLIGIPIFVFCDKISPIIYLFGMTVVLITLGRKIKDDPWFIFFILFFTLLGIPLTIAPALLHMRPIANHLLINTFQATNIFDSQPTAYSLLLLFSGVVLILNKKHDIKKYFLISLLLFILFGTKFYTAFLFLSIVSIYEVVRIIQKKQTVKSGMLHLFLYLLFTAGSISVFLDPIHSVKGLPLFTFSPFATVHHLIEDPSLFTIKNMILARYYLYEKGMSPRLLGIELFSSFLFVLFYFGIRIIGFFYLAKQYVLRKASALEIASGISIGISLLISMLFIQRGDWYNPIQFAVSASYLLSIYAALFCFEVFKWNKRVFSVIFAIVLICVIPSNLMNFTYLQSVSRQVIPYGEVDALMFLKGQKDGPVFLPVEGPDSPYLPIFTGKVTYFNFANQLDNFGVDTSKRKQQLANYDEMYVNELEIKYAYLRSHFDQYPILYRRFKKSSSYKIIFKNKDVTIFEKIK